MSDQETDVTQVTQDELKTLKDRADLMGITYHPSIGLEKLREKVKATIEGQPEEVEVDPGKEAWKEHRDAKLTAQEQRKKLQDEARKLVRIRLTCMNPAKSEYTGEIFTVGNSVVGTYKNFVPFNNDEGWHVPHIMYEMLRDRTCQIFTTVKLPGGGSHRQGKLIKEFAIEVLPSLSTKELEELARKQAVGRTVD